MGVMQYISGGDKDDSYDLDWCRNVQWMVDIELVKQIGVIGKVGVDWVIVGVNYCYIVQQQYYYQCSDKCLYVVFCDDNVSDGVNCSVQCQCGGNCDQCIYFNVDD